MLLEKNDIYYLLEIAKTAAIDAGNHIAGFSNIDIEVQKKSSGTSLASQVVTEADLLSQKVILEHLTPTISRYDLALLTEESPDDNSRFEKDYFWCIDPLDGTLAFIESTHGYSVSIGLVSKLGEPIIGVIYDPLLKCLYWAGKNIGAFINNFAWNFPSVTETNDLMLVCDKSFLEYKHYNTIKDRLEFIVQKYSFDSLKIKAQGGAAMNAMWVLENNQACYFKLPRKSEGGGSLWDYAASSCIFKEIAAVATDCYGNDLDLNRKDSTYLNHNGVLFASNRILADEIIKLAKDELFYL